MSDAESSNYSSGSHSWPGSNDVQSTASSSHTVSPINRTFKTKHAYAPSSNYLGTESVILAFLFGSVALLLPAFFYFISSQSSQDHAGLNSLNFTMSAFANTPLATVVSYIPQISTLIYKILLILRIALRPVVALLSFAWTALAPVIIVTRLIFQILITGPIGVVTGVIRFFYPVYVFLGVACLFGAGVGMIGRALVEGGRILLGNPPPPAPHSRKGKQKAV